jgi:hypothetical protein
MLLNVPMFTVFAFGRAKQGWRRSVFAHAGLAA